MQPGQFNPPQLPALYSSEAFVCRDCRFISPETLAVFRWIRATKKGARFGQSSYVQRGSATNDLSNIVGALPVFYGIVRD